MIFQEKPEGFSSRGDVVGCFVQVGDRFLLLHRSKEEVEAHTWGLPAGKVEAGEGLIEAACREIAEETGLTPLKEQLVTLPSVFVRYNERDFMFHMFEWALEKEPETITLQPLEHSDYCWVTTKEALALEPLIFDLDACIRLVKNIP